MSLFGEGYARHYDGFYLEKDYSAECNMLEEAIFRFSSNRPKALLDVGCGTGGHALELAERGYRVTGVDRSQAMLDAARAKSNKLSICALPNWICGDIRTFKTAHPHDLAYMMFAVVGYLKSNEDVISGLVNVRRHLNPGALFICDFWYGPSVLSNKNFDRIRETAGLDSLVIRAGSTRLDVPNHIAEVTFRLWTLENDCLVDKTVEKHEIRYFFPQEFSLLLSCSGFRLISISAFPSLDDRLTDESFNALVVAAAI